MELTQDAIDRINKASPEDQGIFNEPYGIPDTVKGLVVYMRHETGGVSGGSCWDSSNPQPYTRGPVPDFEVLDLVLRELKPDISYLDFKKIEKLIMSNETSDWEYYGNCTDYLIKYLPLDKLINELT